MYSKKIDSILNQQSGYFFDNGKSVVIIKANPSTIFNDSLIYGGFRLFAYEIDKKTGAETPYRLYKTDRPFELDKERILPFRSFGKGEKGTRLLDDFLKPR